MAKGKSDLVFCGVCNVKGAAQPVLSPMGVVFVEGGKKTEDKQPFNPPHFTYLCPRCGLGEIHEQKVDGSITWQSGRAKGA